MGRDVPALLCAGVAWALIELLWGLVAGRSLFLTHGERLAYAGLALTALPPLVLAGSLLVRGALRGRGALWLWALLAAGAGGLIAFELTEGRRVRELALRPVLIGVAAVVVGLGTRGVLRAAHIARDDPRRGRWLAWLSLALGVVALVVDTRVLVRAYPAFHLALTLLAWGAAALSALLWARPMPFRLAPALATVCAAGLLGVAPWLAVRLRAQPNASFVVEQVAPWTGKLLGLVARFERRGPTATAPAQVPGGGGGGAVARARRGIDLRDRDVLLITVDALRADMLTAYGGSGLAPGLDALAAESLVFRRAYTVAPHTSYALSSLLTAKFLKPVFEVQGASVDPPTLPDLLRRYGYRTAAFYPPAIFFVDGTRFDALRGRGFGFEYRKEMFAPASERVRQVEAYLNGAEPGRPLFVWVHLFEPHEPYAPPPGLARGDTERGRYEGEVIACDRAIADLVARFRARRPQATVILSADHGEEFGDHGGHYHGTSVFDEQVRVPLLWSSPGVVRQGVSDAPVELVDVGTSILSAAGVPREARMRGDDLGAVLAGQADAGPAFAFAAVESRHMVTDGRFKAVCVAREAHCQLFDLVRDPRELRNVAGDHPDELARLRAALDGFLLSIPKVEALSVDDGVAFPAALARARLGGPGAGAEVIPLLSDGRPRIRLLAARTLGEQHVAEAAMALDRLREHDPDRQVRAEAAVASLSLGADAAAVDVRGLLSDPASAGDPSLARRAALALSRLKDPAALPVLSALVHDESADEAERLQAIEAMAALGSQAASVALVDLLSHARLKVAVAGALGRLGGRPAIRALATALRDERYQPARTAEARALQRLAYPGTAGLVTRLLGMETSIPEGVRILLELGVLSPPSAKGAALTAESVRVGSWQCDAAGCAPSAGAEVRLPAAGAIRGPSRVTWLLAGAVGSQLEIDGMVYRLRAEEEQVSLTRDGKTAQQFRFAAGAAVRVVAVSVVPARAEIPPPAPKPWKGDEPADGGLAPSGAK